MNINNDEIKQNIYAEIHEELCNSDWCNLEGEFFEKEVARRTEIIFNQRSV
tara:strand:- start:14 stop:166 length:153 start_codon:yes stop_codon:yes gene_type:complete